ncbi:hypothetical protein [Natronosalvus rutilus]|uniref:Uncharacterized protein n=1 Tax=Natronosalvus rutilus TaxID=2953753 RepID=A0A9E7SXS3_9EURY|nr:hypothetical protein [Natronosalvus rutilus]UTF55361.1 hypothetical protein NGM29_08965 [Natronosalvus rutilus]
MRNRTNTSHSPADSGLECGRTYTHTRHGRVEVTGLWQGTRWVDAVDQPNEGETVVVRYLPPDGETWRDERSALLDDFLAALE